MYSTQKQLRDDGRDGYFSAASLSVISYIFPSNNLFLKARGQKGLSFLLISCIIWQHFVLEFPETSRGIYTANCNTSLCKSSLRFHQTLPFFFLISRDGENTAGQKETTAALRDADTGLS